MWFGEGAPAPALTHSSLVLVVRVERILTVGCHALLGMHRSSRYVRASNPDAW